MTSTMSWPPRSRISVPTAPRCGSSRRGERAAVAGGERSLERLHDLLVRGREQLLVLLVRHLVDAPAQQLASRLGEGGAQPAAVLQLDDLPAGAVEAALERVCADHGHHAIERLAVEVDHPHRLGEAARRGIEDRLPDVALVELGIADQGDEAAALAPEPRRGRRRSAARARRRAAPRRRARPSRSSSRRAPDPSCGSGRPADLRSRAACAGRARRASRAGTRARAARARRAA